MSNSDKKLKLKIDMPVVPVEAVQPLVNKAHIDGKQQGIEFVNKIGAATTNVQTSLAFIAGLANANNGEKTRGSMKAGKATLARSIDNLETVWIECMKNPGFVMSEANLNILLSQVKKVRSKVVEYLKDPTPNKQNDISELYAELQEGAFRDVREHILKVSDNRGRNPDKIKLAIGRLALELGKPQKRRTWKQGQQIYSNLCNIPEHLRSDEHREMINYLGFYMYSSKTEVAKDQRRNCGVFITEAREIANKSGN